MTSAWREAWIVEAGQFARLGFSDHAIAEALETRYETLTKHRKKHPALDRAITEGRAEHARNTNPDKQGHSPFWQYMHDMLPEHLQPVWDEMEEAYDAEGYGGRHRGNSRFRLEKILGKLNPRARQHLFLHAFTSSGFQMLEACRKIGISVHVVRKWVNDDPEFGEIYDHVLIAMKHFGQDALLRLVDAGHPGAVMFFNKSKNADWGYGQKIQVDHSGTLSHNHTVLDLSKLDLPVEVLMLIRERMEKAAGIAKRPEVPLLGTTPDVGSLIGADLCPIEDVDPGILYAPKSPDEILEGDIVESARRMERSNAKSGMLYPKRKAIKRDKKSTYLEKKKREERRRKESEAAK